MEQSGGQWKQHPDIHNMRKTPNDTFLSYVDETYDNISSITSRTAEGRHRQITIQQTTPTKPLPKNKAARAAITGTILLAIALIGFITYPLSAPTLAAITGAGAAYALINIGQKTPPHGLKRKKIWTTITIALFTITITLLPAASTGLFKSLLDDDYTPMAERLQGFNHDPITGLHYKTEPIYPCQTAGECEITIQLANPQQMNTCPNGGTIIIDLVLQNDSADMSSIEIPFTNLTPTPTTHTATKTGNYTTNHMFVIASQPIIACT